MARVAEAAALRAGPRFGNSVENRAADPPSVQIRSDAEAPIRNGQLAFSQPLSRVHPPLLLRPEEAAAGWLLSAARPIQGSGRTYRGRLLHARTRKPPVRVLSSLSACE
jgi:hypothetical protein